MTALRPTLLVIALALGAPAAFAQAPPACPFPGQVPKLVVQLFFGQMTKTHAPVSHRAWERFVADTITPALPGGFTVYDAYGQYRDPRTGAIGREGTEVLVVAADDTPDFHTRITGLMDAYRRRFDQLSVGILAQPGCGMF